MLLLYNIVLKVIIKNYAFRKSKICLTYKFKKKNTKDPSQMRKGGFQES